MRFAVFKEASQRQKFKGTPYFFPSLDINTLDSDPVTNILFLFFNLPTQYFKKSLHMSFNISILYHGKQNSLDTSDPLHSIIQ